MSEQTEPATSEAAAIGRSPVPWQVKYASLVVIWGSSFFLIALALRGFAPIQLTTVRLLAGAGVLLILARRARTRLPSGTKTWAHLFVGGFFLGAFPFSMFAFAEERIPSALAGIANATTPLSGIVCAFLFLPEDRLPPRKLLAVLLGFVGVVVILQPWHGGGPDLVGFSMALLGGTSYGVGWAYNRRMLADQDLGGLAQPLATILTGLVLELVVLLGFWILHRDTLATPWSPAVGTDGHTVAVALLAAVVLGMFGTGLAFALQFDVVRATGPTVATTVTFLLPIVAVALGVLFLGEHLTVWEVVGGLIVLGAAISLSARNAR